MALLTSCDHLIITYGSYGTMAAYFIAGRAFSLIQINNSLKFDQFTGEGEVVAADNFTTKPNTFSENIRKSNWPNWHFMSID